MTLEALNGILGERSSTTRASVECCAQGTGNILSSMLGGIGGNSMIGQSQINISINGARGRLSTVSAAIFLMCIVLSLATVIELIPVAALTGVLVMVVLQTFQWSTFRILRRIPKSDAVNIILVTVLAATVNLAVAIGAGVVWQCIVYAWKAGKQFALIEEVSEEEGEHFLEENEDTYEHADVVTHGTAASQRSDLDLNPVLRDSVVGEGDGGDERPASPTQVLADIEEGKPGATVASTPSNTEATGSGTTSNAPTPRRKRKVLRLHGPLFFGSAYEFRHMIRDKMRDENTEYVLAFDRSSVQDMTAVEALRDLERAHAPSVPDVKLVSKGLDPRSIRRLRTAGHFGPSTDFFHHGRHNAASSDGREATGEGLDEASSPILAASRAAVVSTPSEDGTSGTDSDAGSGREGGAGGGGHVGNQAHDGRSRSDSSDGSDGEAGGAMAPETDRRESHASEKGVELV